MENDWSVYCGNNTKYRMQTKKNHGGKGVLRALLLQRNFVAPLCATYSISDV